MNVPFPFLNLKFSQLFTVGNHTEEKMSVNFSKPGTRVRTPKKLQNNFKLCMLWKWNHEPDNNSRNSLSSQRSVLQLEDHKEKEYL